MKKEKVSKYESFRDMVLSERKKGNIVCMTVEGPMSASLEEFIQQPVEGILYDLNRDEATILTFIENIKWFNDYAAAQVIIALTKKIYYLESVVNELNAKSQ